MGGGPGSGGMAATGLAAAVIAVIGKPLPTISEATTTTTTTQFTNVSSTNTSPEKGSYGNGLDDKIEADAVTADFSVAYPSSVQSCPPTADTPTKSKKRFGNPKYAAGKLKPSILKKRTNNPNDTNSKRERKAAKTLAIITGMYFQMIIFHHILNYIILALFFQFFHRCIRLLLASLFHNSNLVTCLSRM